jgi:hypothetical protein
VHPLQALTCYALWGLPLGLLSGLGLGLIARREDGWGGYGSFRRRAARLGHVALVMLPVLAGLYALLLAAGPSASVPLAWAVRLWIPGSLALCAALFLAAWRPALRVLLVVPALALTAGAVLFACAYAGS